jgi:hypothetical protein
MKKLSYFFLVFCGLMLVGTLQAQSSKTTKITFNNSARVYQTNNSFGSFQIEYRGTLEVTDDDKDIKSISQGGYLEVSKTTFGNKRAIRIEATGRGELSREYVEGRTKTAWEPNGRKWLAEILPEIVRSTTIAAEGRVNRYFAQGGVSAVLNEIGQLEGSHTKAHYAKLLMEKKFSDKELPGIVARLSREVKSDYYLAEFLKGSSDRLLANQESSKAFYEGVGRMSSDYYKATVISSALKKDNHVTDNFSEILRASQYIASDYYLATVLSKMLDIPGLTAKHNADIMGVANQIKSDYYRTSVLNKNLNKAGATGEGKTATMESVASVNSDYYKSTTLAKMAEAEMTKDEQTKFLAIVAEMTSDYYAATLLTKFAKNQQLAEENFLIMTKVMGKMSSDYYAATSLKAASVGPLSEARLLAVIEAAGQIKSDYYLSTVLMGVSEQVADSSEEIKKAYMKTAKNIRSETYYGRVVRGLY